VALTGEFKFEQGKSDSYLMLPVEYLKVAQCPNFILEDPFKIAEFIEEYKANKSAFYEMVEQMTMIGDEFKEKLKSQMTIVE
jgi:alpha-glucosidase